MPKSIELGLNRPEAAAGAPRSGESRERLSVDERVDARIAKGKQFLSNTGKKIGSGFRGLISRFKEMPGKLKRAALGGAESSVRTVLTGYEHGKDIGHAGIEKAKAGYATTKEAFAEQKHNIAERVYGDYENAKIVWGGIKDGVSEKYRNVVDGAVTKYEGLKQRSLEAYVRFSDRVAAAKESARNRIEAFKQRREQQAFLRKQEQFFALGQELGLDASSLKNMFPSTEVGMEEVREEAAA